MGVRVALAAKCKEGNLIIVEDVQIDEVKTKQVIDIIESHGWNEGNQGTLLLDHPLEDDFELASRNIPLREFYAASVDDLLKESNVYDIVLREKLVLTKPAFDYIQERLSEK